MGKARRERERREHEEARRRRAIAIWIATGVVAVALAATAGILSNRTDSAPLPSAADPTSPDAQAPPELVAAAKALDFRPHTEPGVGLMEDKPASAAREASNPDLLAPGTQAPPFSLRTPEGDTVSLADYRGKAVLLELFATWCPHCQAEAPHLERLSDQLDPAKAAIVAIDGSSADAASVYAFHRYFGLTYPALLDPSGTPGSFTQPGPAGPVSRSYRLGVFPTFYVIGPDGTVRWAGDGEQPTAKLRQELQRAANA
jgi:peroxiredoxin